MFVTMTPPKKSMSDLAAAESLLLTRLTAADWLNQTVGSSGSIRVGKTGKRIFITFRILVMLR